jgi:hypothetical protein
VLMSMVSVVVIAPPKRCRSEGLVNFDQPFFRQQPDTKGGLLSARKNFYTVGAMNEIAHLDSTLTSANRSRKHLHRASEQSRTIDVRNRNSSFDRNPRIR